MGTHLGQLYLIRPIWPTPRVVSPATGQTRRRVGPFRQSHAGSRAHAADAYTWDPPVIPCLRSALRPPLSRGTHRSVLSSSLSPRRADSRLRGSDSVHAARRRRLWDSVGVRFDPGIRHLWAPCSPSGASFPCAFHSAATAYRAGE